MNEEKYYISATMSKEEQCKLYSTITTLKSISTTNTVKFNYKLSLQELEELSRIAPLLDNALDFLDRAALRLSALPLPCSAALDAPVLEISKVLDVLNKEVRWYRP